MVRHIPAWMTVLLLARLAGLIGLALLVSWAAQRTPRARERLRRRATLSAVFFAALSVYLANGNRHLQVDTQPAVFGAMSFLRQGWFDLTPFERSVEPLRPSVLLTGADGLTYTRYPPGSTLACIPFAMPIARVSRLTDLDVDAASKLTGAFTSALSVAFLFAALLRLGIAGGPLWLSTAAYAFGTTLLSTASQDAWQHGPAMLGLMVALHGIVRSHQDRKPGAAWQVGAGFGWAFLCRSTMLVPAVLIGLHLLARDRRRLAAACAGAIPFAAFWTLWAGRIYGSPFRTGYGSRGEGVIQSGFSGHLWRTFFDPSRGIFVFSPFLLVAVAGLVLMAPAIRRRGKDQEPLASVGVFAFSALPVAAYIAAINMYWGGWSYGYRPASECAALLMPAFALAAARVWPRRWARPLLGALVAVSIFIHALEWAFPNDVWNAREELRSRSQILVHIEVARGRLGI